MKHILILLAFLGYSSLVVAQSDSTIVLKGNVFSKVEKLSDITKTEYKWKDSKDVEYNIYISEKGAAFIYRKSKKTGKIYRQYLPKEVAQTIRRKSQQ